MSSVNITYAGFINSFPEFSDTTEYPIAVVEGFLLQAQCYISPDNAGYMVNASRELAIYLEAAHLLTINKYILTGNTSGVLMNSATIGNVSISGTPPAAKDLRDQWYCYTIYGVRLKSLLDSYIGMGMYMPGRHGWGI